MARFVVSSGKRVFIFLVFIAIEVLDVQGPWTMDVLE